VPPAVANAACRAAATLVRVVDLQHRYGTPTEGGAKVLEPAPGEPANG
jgi:hypothetical protein